KFVCSCGKHLRARDEMAARRSVCPRCGAPVGIPSLKPHHPGALAPLTPWERERLARKRQPAPAPEPEPPPPAAPPPAEGRGVRLLSPRGRRRRSRSGRHLERHWYECLLYPLRAWRVCLGLGLIWALLSCIAVVFLPPALASPPEAGWALAA